MANCKFCGAQIEWAEMEGSRHSVPIDPGVFADGTLAVVDHGLAHAYTDRDEQLERPRRRPHTASCTNPGRKWRRLPWNRERGPLY